MPAMQTLLGELSAQFRSDKIGGMVKNIAMFAPGSPIHAGLVALPDTPLHRAVKSHLANMPESFHEALRAIIHQALSTTPPTQITFAWAPGYDYELTLWQAPDTKATKGGITVLVKSRYPDDRHPLASEGAT
jgi:hypothetical protein